MLFDDLYNRDILPFLNLKGKEPITLTPAPTITHFFQPIHRTIFNL
jgi:hypothetical protein